MKTTNFEISKKLKEAGFEAETNTLIHDPSNPITGERYASFCLETILEALPVFIKINKEYYHLWLWNDGIGYYPSYDKYSGEYVYDMDNGIFEFSEDESLADTAGRLWLLLKEKGLV